MSRLIGEKMRGNCLRSFLRTNSSCERNGVFSSMFRKISVSKQSISSAFMFLRMLGAALSLISDISSVFCGKYRNYAENIGIMRKMRISVNYADPHRRILSDAM